MVNTRRDPSNLSDFPFRTLEDVEKYSESCLSSLYYMLNEKILEVSSEKSAGYRISLDHIASHLGKAQGLTNILRGIKHNASARRCYIPNDILMNNTCTHEDFLRGNMNESVCNAVFAVASQANSHLDHCIELLRDLKVAKRSDKLVYLPYVAIKNYLDLLQKCNFNVLEGKLYQRNGTLPLQLLWKSIFM